ncbi:unnamed protein product [Dovyalis caffra]|uniref:Uncharacterized protein n=1 Tax=Dovyalis caffra TaxID=77055 RepID=A0AAV1SA61_9ROSI|nr:unnamed protein product [Dovyalis caffra]
MRLLYGCKGMKGVGGFVVVIACTKRKLIEGMREGEKVRKLDDVCEEELDNTITMGEEELSKRVTHVRRNLLASFTAMAR